LFDHAFSIASIASAASARPSWWTGIGWRTNFLGNVGLLGSHDGCVEIRFRDVATVSMPLPSRCQRLTISLKLPREFLSSLAAAGVDATSGSTSGD
jgi:hypothetical protein